MCEEGSSKSGEEDNENLLLSDSDDNEATVIHLESNDDDDDDDDVLKEIDSVLEDGGEETMVKIQERENGDALELPREVEAKAQSHPCNVSSSLDISFDPKVQSTPNRPLPSGKVLQPMPSIVEASKEVDYSILYDDEDDEQGFQTVALDEAMKLDFSLLYSDDEDSNEVTVVEKTEVTKSSSPVTVNDTKPKATLENDTSTKQNSVKRKKPVAKPADETNDFLKMSIWAVREKYVFILALAKIYSFFIYVFLFKVLSQSCQIMAKVNARPLR